MGGAQAPSIDLFAILVAVLRRWKLITAITLSALIATYGVLKLVPPVYKSTVEILVYDPQRQIDTAVQKPISPFVDAIGYDAMNTEINIIKSKSVALRVARELGLDTDPEFQPHDRLGGMWRNGRNGLVFPAWAEPITTVPKPSAARKRRRPKSWTKQQMRCLGTWRFGQNSYIIFVSTTSQNPIKAQRLASTIANDYLASQREARQEALERVATWLKGRVDDLQSRVLETESSIEKLKAESGIRDTEFEQCQRAANWRAQHPAHDRPRRGRRETCPPRTGASRDRHQWRYPEYPRADRFHCADRATPKTDWN